MLNQIIDSMLDHAVHNWQSYVSGGYIYIDATDVLDMTFTRLYGYDMPDDLHKEFMQNSDFMTGIEFMRELIKDNLDDYRRVTHEVIRLSRTIQ